MKKKNERREKGRKRKKRERQKEEQRKNGVFGANNSLLRFRMIKFPLGLTFHL
jgi:hypothetical protein